jgi:hypothetical protein
MFTHLESEYKTRGHVYKHIVPGRVVVEIGVFKGDNAKQILTHKPSFLYLVDPWRGMAASGDEDGQHRTTVNLEVEYKRLQRELYGEPVELLRGTSPAILDQITIEPDFVYVDGDHTKPAVYADLIAAYNLLHGRRGTVIGGHDYSKRTPGVIEAVNQFCQHKGLSIHTLTTNDIPSYFIVL